MTSSVTVQSNEKLLGMLERMLTIRRFEERVRKEFAASRVKGFVHLYIGEEAIAVGVCSNLRDDDYVTSTHRGHGHCIAKGIEIKSMMAELFGKRTGTCKGKGGSMHISDLTLGMLGANGIVAGGVPHAVGAALSSKYRGTDQVAVAFFSDGALNQGVLHESMNLASIWKLPVIFVLENNQYAESTSIKYATSVEDPTIRGSSYSIPSSRIDGMDVMAVYETAAGMIARARRGEGPSYLVCDTYRYMGHFEGDDQKYRTSQEVDEWKRVDPISRFKSSLINQGNLSEERYREIDGSILREVDEAVEYAEKSEWPSPDEVMDDIYSSM
jgi:acetoin:2,6-dichlorophenolindophenol oxidoreductase subunit alpha